MEGISLTDKETQQWEEIGQEVLASEEIKRLALQFYLEYRQYLTQNHLAKTHVFDAGQLANLFRVAYLLSEKKQQTFNMKGEKINAVALSVNGILKKSPNYDDFLYHLKEMMKVAAINDEAVEKELSAFIKSFSFTLTFNNKFISTFQKIKPISEDASLEQSLLWLVFILAKKILFVNKSDIIDTTCLIAITFIYYLREKLQLTDGKSQFILDDHNYGGKLKKQSVQHVFLEYFRLKDMSAYSQVFTNFNQLLQELTPKKLLFSPQTLEQTYKHFDKIYQKKLTEESIDQRHFLKDRINTIQNANRFTPFGGRRAVIKVKSTQNMNKIMSHRVLNYEKCDDSNSEGESTETSTGSGLFKNLTLTKTPYSTLIKMTPMSQAMQMHNWVLQKSNYYKYDASQLPKISAFEGEVSDKSLKMISSLWKDIYLTIGEKSQVSENDKKIYLVLAMQVVYYIINSTANPIELTIKQIGISWFNLWSKIDSVLKYDGRMPTNIKVHLLGLETSIVSNYLWKQDSILFSIVKPQSGMKLRQTTQQYDRLFKRVIHQLVYQIYFLSKKLELPDEVINNIFQLCQHSIGQFPQILKNRNLNHLILACTYALCKVYVYQIKFNSIISCFKELNNLSESTHFDLIEKIPYEGSFINIIKFYNGLFIGRARQFLKQLRQAAQSQDKKIKPNKNYITNEVKELLPQNMVIMAEKISKTPQTPLTQALLAYNESPLLREKRIKNIGNYVDGKRLLEKKEWSKEESLTSASSMISKKFGSKVKSPEMRATIKKV